MVISVSARCEYVVRSSCFAKLAQDLSDKDPTLDRLPPQAKKQLYKALVYAGSASFVDDSTKNQYWNLVNTSYAQSNEKVVS